MMNGRPGQISIICPYCGVGCNLSVLLDEQGIPFKSKASGINREVNGNYLCIKGFAAHEFIHNRERLDRALVRKDGHLEPCGWDGALDKAAEEFKRVMDGHGRDSVAMMVSSKILNEEAYVCQKFQRVVIGNNHVDNCSRLCHGPSEVALNRQLGFGAASVSLDDFDLAETVFVVGAHTNATHPIAWMRLRKRAKEGDIHLVLADPRSTDLAKFAHLHLKVKPGTDMFWIHALSRIIMDRGGRDEDFCRRSTIGCDAFVHSLQNVDIDTFTRRAGLSRDILERAADLLEGKKTIFLWGMGLTQHAHGTANVTALLNLALYTGNVGKHGCGLAPLRGQNNVQGTCDMGALPHLLPGQMPVEDEAARLHVGTEWDAAVLPSPPGFSLSEMIHEIASGRIHALYIVGENPVMSEPQSTFVSWMLQRLDLLIVQDVFLTETARYAHIVFPAAVVGEKDGTFTNAVRRIQYSSGGLRPPGEARPDWWIVQKLAGRMGRNWGYRSSEEIWEEVRRVAPIFSGVTYDRLRRGPGILWPCYDESHPGTPRLFLDGFAFRDRRARFLPPRLPEAIMERTVEYPFILITGRLLQHFNTGAMSRRSEKLMRSVGESFLMMHPVDAENGGFADGDRIRITSPYGTALSVLRVTGEVPAGYLFIPIHFLAPNVNILTSAVPMDSQARMPALKVIPAAVEPA